MKNLYKRDNEYFIMFKPVGSWNREDCRHYALWQPVKRFLWIFWINSREKFWLDMYKFEKVK